MQDERFSAGERGFGRGGEGLHATPIGLGILLGQPRLVRVGIDTEFDFGLDVRLAIRCWSGGEMDARADVFEFEGVELFPRLCRKNLTHYLNCGPLAHLGGDVWCAHEVEAFLLRVHLQEFLGFLRLQDGFVLAEMFFGLDKYALKVNLWVSLVHSVDDGFNLIQRGTRVTHDELRGGRLKQGTRTFWKADALLFEHLLGGELLRRRCGGKRIASKRITRLLAECEKIGPNPVNPREHRLVLGICLTRLLC